MNDSNPARNLLSPPGSSGLRSPTEKRSPSCSRGRTMKDIEEELFDLRRENFDLKMRIYIMEEQQEKLYAEKDPEELQKANAALKSQLGVLKKDLAEKEDLILEAAKAMDLVSARYKEDIQEIQNKSKAEMEKLKQTVRHLEEELKSAQEKATDRTLLKFDDSSAMYAMAFGLQQHQPSQQQLAEEQIASLELQVAKLENELKDEVSKRNEAEDMVHKLQTELIGLQEVNNTIREDLASYQERLRASKDNQMTAELQKKLNEIQDRERQVVKLQTVLEATQAENAQLHDQLNSLRTSYKEMKAAVGSASYEELKADYTKALRTIQDFVAHNKVLTRDLKTFKKRFGDMEADKGGGGDPRTGPEQYKVQIKELSEELALVMGERDALSLEMEKQVQTLLKSLKEKEDQIRMYEEKTENLTTSATDLQIAELRDELNSLRQQLNSQGSESEEGNTKLTQELEAKKKEIDHLNEELRKRTFNLQELVNTELWDKNREIEKLNKNCEKKQAEVTALRKQLSAKDEEIKKLEEKLKSDCTNTVNKEVDEQQLEELKRQITKDNELINSLKEECVKWKKESETSEKSRKELVNACTLLTTRLEELATFLDSLLPALGEKKRRMVQEAIDRSREFSRSLSFSVSGASAVAILPDFSQVEFFSGDEGGGDVAVAGEVENDEVVRLRTEVESLVERLRRRSPPATTPRRRLTVWTDVGGFDLEEGLALEDVTAGSLLDTLESDSKATSDQQPPRPLGRQDGAHSESEGWSEPDRSVSLARIGIREDSVPSRLSTDESSSSFRKSFSAPSSVKKGKHEMGEVRRLNSKIRSLEEINNALRVELRALCKGSTAKVDKAISCQCPGENPISKFLLSEVRSQREKLKSSLSHNEIICKQLEDALQFKRKEGVEMTAIAQLREMSDQLEESCNLCIEMESRCLALETECGTLKRKLAEEEGKNKALGDQLTMLKAKSSEAERLSQEAGDLRAALKEKENEALEKQCLVLELRNSQLVLENRLRVAQDAADHASAEKQALKEKNEQETSKLRSRLNQLKIELEKLGRDHREALTAANRKIEELTILKEMAEDEWKVKLESMVKEKKDEVEAETSRRMEVERKLVASYEMQSELRTRLEGEMARSREAEATRKVEERRWRERRLEVEAELRRRLDAATLTTSEAVLERTRLANDKLRLQHDLRAKDDYTNQVKSELERRVAELEAANEELESRLETLKVHPHELASPTHAALPLPSSSDYMSDPDHLGSTNANFWFPVCGRSNNNSSPDLGIESDQGRMSSLEPVPGTNSHGLEAENEELRSQLKRTREALEDTLSQLTLANQKKRQVERAISRQLHKTHHILHRARLNLETQE